MPMWVAFGMQLLSDAAPLCGSSHFSNPPPPYLAQRGRFAVSCEMSKIRALAGWRPINLKISACNYNYPAKRHNLLADLTADQTWDQP
jgi:hypothetical protein